MCVWLCLFGVVGSCFPGVREKLNMAWRHRSSTEKAQLGAIGFLVFALFCFIIAVVAMDLSFKKKIHDLEDELDAMKTTMDDNSTTIATDTTDTTDTSTTTSTTTSSTTDPTTTSTTTKTTPTESTTSPTTSTVTITSTIPTSPSTSDATQKPLAA